MTEVGATSGRNVYARVLLLPAQMPSSDAAKVDAIALEKLQPWPQGLWLSLCSLLFNRRSRGGDEAIFDLIYARVSRQQIQLGLIMSMGITVLLLFAPGPVAHLRASMFAEHSATLDVMRFYIFLPTAVLLFAVAYSSLYERYFSQVAQWIALIHVGSLTATEVVVSKQGYSVSVWMAVSLFGMFSAYGLNPRQSLRTGLLAIAIYYFGCQVGNDVAPRWYFDFAMLIFALISGAAVQMALFTAVRAQYAARLSLTESAQRDGLTQLHNRRTFDERMELLWSQASRDEISIGLLMVDIDFFKPYNDSKGHLAGDDCLTQVAKTLAACARRPMDIVARYGGEEFAILLYDIDREALDQAAQDLNRRIAELALEHPASPISRTLTVSVGAACIVPRHQRSYLGIVQLADEALYGAKQLGRNRAVILDKEYDTLVTGVFRGQIGVNSGATNETHHSSGNNAISSDHKAA